jgi:putative ABC transport system permease protein
VRLYRWLLRLAAPALARDYAAAMEEMLADRLREARSFTLQQRLRLWFRELGTLAALAWSERFGEGVSGRRRRQREYNRFKAGPMDTLGQEIHQAARRLWRSPAFTLASVLTLALAIGANAAIFAVVERVIINPLPYPESDRLIDVDHGSVAFKVQSGMRMTSGMYFMYQERARSLTAIAIHASSDRTLVGDGEPERLRVTATTPSLAAVLRVTPVAGRWFTDDEGKPGGRAVAVLSYGLWSRRFGRNPAVVGQSILLNGQSREVIGVMPPAFAFPERRIDIWVPEQLSVTMGFGLFSYLGVARLADGASLDTALAEINGLLPGIADAYPGDPLARGNLSMKISFVGRALKDAVLGNVTRGLWLLLAAVGVVLLIACANVANLFLVRSEARQREVAIRRALGAARLGLGRFFLTESLLLATIGGALGVMVAWGALRLLVRFGPAALPRLHEIRLDAVTIGYVAILSVLVAVIFGSIPMWRGPSMAALHDGGRGNTTTRHSLLARQLLLGAQVALALVLLVGSGLMVRSFLNLRAIDPGFNPDSALTFSVGVPERKYPTIDQAIAVHDAVVERLAALPGVAAVAGTTCLPLNGGCTGNTVLIEGVERPAGTLPPLVMFRAITGGYFEAMGMRLLRGRAIDRADVDNKRPVAVISESMARRAFDNHDPIGKRVASNQPPGRAGRPPTLAWLEIVGVVTDVPAQALNEPTRMPMLYTPLSLARGPATPIGAMIAPGTDVVSYVVRTTVPPEEVALSVRQAVRAVDDQMAMAQVMTLQDMIERASAQLTFTMVLLAIAALGALMLGVIGIYGVTSYIVSQRTSEIGVRLALGAEPGGITGQIVRQGGLVAFIGIGVGLAGAFAGSRLIASVLYGVDPRDPIVFGAMAITLQLIALLACWVPARRAAQLSPTIALRAD